MESPHQRFENPDSTNQKAIIIELTNREPSIHWLWKFWLRLCGEGGRVVGVGVHVHRGQEILGRYQLSK